MYLPTTYVLPVIFTGRNLQRFTQYSLNIICSQTQIIILNIHFVYSSNMIVYKRNISLLFSENQSRKVLSFSRTIIIMTNYKLQITACSLTRSNRRAEISVICERGLLILSKPEICHYDSTILSQQTVLAGQISVYYLK